MPCGVTLARETTELALQRFELTLQARDVTLCSGALVTRARERRIGLCRRCDGALDRRLMLRHLCAQGTHAALAIERTVLGACCPADRDTPVRQQVGTLGGHIYEPGLGTVAGEGFAGVFDKRCLTAVS